MIYSGDGLAGKGAEAGSSSDALLGKRFVWLLVPPWDGVWTRQNHFTLRLAKAGAEVLYVEAPRGWRYYLRQREINRLTPWLRARPDAVQPGITRVRLSAAMPGSMRSELVARFYGRRYAHWILRELERRGWRDYLCWCRVPLSLHTLGHLRPRRVVYDITDDYSHFVSAPAARRRLQCREQALLQRADRVFVTAASLLERPDLRAAGARLIPNGVDYELFSQASQRQIAPHPILRDLKVDRGPLIGFVGLISHWMDFELVRMLGERWPGRVVMVGPIQPAQERQARAIPGVLWTGFVKQREELPSIIRGFSVCIMPFLVSELTNNMNPLKIWEYLATGKPFVSTNLRAVQPIGEHIDVARSNVEFLALVQRRLDKGDEERAADRMRVAREFSWETIFERVVAEIRPLLR